MPKGKKEEVEETRETRFRLDSKANYILECFKELHSLDNKEEAINGLIKRMGDIDENLNKYLRLKKEVKNG